MKNKSLYLDKLKDILYKSISNRKYAISSKYWQIVINEILIPINNIKINVNQRKI